MARCLNIVGLVLNFVGVALLTIRALKPVRHDGQPATASDAVGCVFLAIGFLIQIIAASLS
jgi:hypothetical protein